MLTKEALAFILTGIGATSIDLFLFNSLILKLQVQTFTANLLATSSAMLFSFFVNRLVFGYAEELSPLIAGKFLLVTLLSAWIIQTAVIRLLLLHFLSN